MVICLSAGIVSDVMVKYQGSRYNRFNGVDISGWSGIAAGVAPPSPSTYPSSSTSFFLSVLEVFDEVIVSRSSEGAEL